MTKRDELAVLDKAISELGADSYLGPWLAESRAEVAQAIKSDMFPVCSWKAAIAQAAEQAQAILEQAHKEAEAIKLAAEREAKSTRQQRDACLQYGFDALNQAIKRLQGYV